MKIYALILGYEGGDEVLGVYSTNDKALAAMNDFPGSSLTIYEMEVDPAGPVEKYEMWQCASAGTDGSIGFFETKLKPSTAAQGRWGICCNSKHVFNFNACAKTKEEAEAAARAGAATFDPVWQVGFAKGCSRKSLIEVERPHPSTVYNWEQPYVVHKDLSEARRLAMQQQKQAA